MNIFNYFDMAGTYDSRNVANYEKNGLIVDTSAVTDSDQPFETGIRHPFYNDGDWIIVELYDTEDAAQEGHKRWVKKMSTPPLPESIADVSTSGIGELFRAVGGKMKHNLADEPTKKDVS